MPGGRWLAENQTLLEIVQRVYRDYSVPGLIVGGPDWVREARFDIDARAGAAVSAEQMQTMLTNLLAERFSFRSHIETRPVAGYALVIARPDGRLGPALKPSSAACVAARERDPRNPRPPECASESGQARNGVARVAEQGWFIDQLRVMIQTWMQRPVADRTGLTGRYDFDFDFDFATTRSIAAPDSSAASIFTALQERLGLKLQAVREPMQSLVIDRAEPPQPN
jgi:uncharacterized protein (TIGR03435 family)